VPVEALDEGCIPVHTQGKVISPRFVDPVKEEVKKMGFQTFALMDQFEELKRGFLIMDGVLAMVGMIAIVVATSFPNAVKRKILKLNLFCFLYKVNSF